MLVENGGTVVIGGIYEQNDREDITKVPFLGDVPVVGNLFKTRSRTATKTELLIFITPKVVTERFGGALRRAPEPRRRWRCATSTSAAARTVPAGWWSSCRTTRSASTSASRARRWWSTSCARSLPEQLRRRLDVTDFGTPVSTISAVQNGDRVRLTIEPKGNWEHSAYQSDNQFVLEVRPQQTDPNKLVQGPGYAGEKLSLNFQNIEVRALLQVIADFTNFNVVTSDSVTGNVTLRLKDVPWDQALDIILQAKSLGLRKTGNVILIAPKEELAASEKLELEVEGPDRLARTGAHAVVPAQLRARRRHRAPPAGRRSRAPARASASVPAAASAPRRRRASCRRAAACCPSRAPTSCS